MIGYGLADTSVQSIDIRTSDEHLALAVYTTENDLIGALGSNNVASAIKYDPTVDSYTWYKVIDDVNVSSRYIFIYFTPNGGKVLVFFYLASTNGPAMLFLDANTGAMLGTDVAKKVTENGAIYSRDYLTMNSDGSKVYWVHQRDGWRTATIHGYDFDGTNWS